ncbi:hypothetical protein Tco_1532250 [Tanacetum coccineum]
MRELRRKLFKGTDDEDAHEHVRSVLEIADLFHFLSVTLDVVMLRVFPNTLKGPALRWINRLSAGREEGKNKIRNFKQEVDESLCRAWERYSDLLYRCPQHDLNSQQRVHIFYTGLYIPTRIMLDSKGFIPLMTPTQALKSIQVMADHSRIGMMKQPLRKESKARTTMGKENVKEPVPRDLPVVQTYVPPMKFLGSSSRTHETVCMMGIQEEIHKMKAYEVEGNTDDGWDITIKNVDRFRQILIPTIHTLPNLKPMVQSYVTRGPIHDKEKVVREKEQDYDIPLQDHIMQPLTPQQEEFANNTRVFEKIDSNPVNDLKELLKTYDFETFIRELPHQLSQSSHKTGEKRLLNRRFARILLLHLSLDEESNTQGSPLF